MGDYKEKKQISDEELTDQVTGEDAKDQQSFQQKASPEKKPKKLTSEEEIQKAKEEIEKLLEQMENLAGLSKDDVRVIKIKAPKRTFKAMLLNAVYSLILNCILIVSISGYLVWAKEATPLQLFYFALLFTAFEQGYRIILVFFFPAWIFKSMGLVLALPPFLSVLSSILVGSSFVAITSTSTILVMFMLLFILRQVFHHIINNYRRK